MTTQEINGIIDYGNNLIMSAIFNDLMKEHGKIKPDLQRKWREYDGDVKILERKPAIGTPDYKSNNKLRNDYRSTIVDQGITFFIANSISTILTEENKSNVKADKAIKDFLILNSADDLDLETALYSAVCGYSGRLLYIDKVGEIKAMTLPPWEVIYVYDKTTDELQYALIYYKVTKVNPQTNMSKERTRIEWYDKTNVYYFIETDNPAGDISSFFILDSDEERNPQAHGFEGVPLVEFLNNNSRKGDFDRVGDLIDAYDRLMSDSQNELEDLRNAYMVFKGLVPGEKEMAAAKKTGAFGSEDPDFDVSFLTKELTGTFHTNHQEALNKNIYKFSKRVDLQADKIISGVVSGVAFQRMLQDLENDVTMKERKFVKALRSQYQLLCSVWNKQGIQIDVTMIEFQFSRKMPLDLEYWGAVITSLWGKVPRKIIYGLVPFIKDPETAIAMLEEEDPSNVNLEEFENKLKNAAEE